MIMKSIVQFKKKIDMTVKNEHMKKRQLGSKQLNSYSVMEIFTHNNPNTFSNVLSRIPLVPKVALDQDIDEFKAERLAEKKKLKIKLLESYKDKANNSFK